MTKPRTPEEIADKLLRDLGLVFDPHEKEDLRLILAALREAAEGADKDCPYRETVSSLHKLLFRIHEAIGEAPESDDDSLPDVIAQIVSDYRERVAELEHKLARKVTNIEGCIYYDDEELCHYCKAPRR